MYKLTFQLSNQKFVSNDKRSSCLKSSFHLLLLYYTLISSAMTNYKMLKTQVQILLEKEAKAQRANR